MVPASLNVSICCFHLSRLRVFWLLLRYVFSENSYFPFTVAVTEQQLIIDDNETNSWFQPQFLSEVFWHKLKIEIISNVTAKDLRVDLMFVWPPGSRLVYLRWFLSLLCWGFLETLTHYFLFPVWHKPSAVIQSELFHRLVGTWSNTPPPVQPPVLF